MTDATTRPRATSEWRIAFALAWIVTASLALVLAIDLAGVGVRRFELQVRVAHLALSVLVAAMLWHRRHRPTSALSVTALLLLFVPLFPSLWLSEQTLAAAGRSGVPWQPFFGHKVTAVGLAILAPRPVWFTPVILAGLLVHGVALWFSLDLGDPGATIPSHEPWESLAYLAISTAVYWVGVRHRNAVAHARAEAATYEAMTKAFIAARDLATTPLQNLELSIGLIEREHPEAQKYTVRARRSLARLTALLELFPAREVACASVDRDVLLELSRRATLPGAPGS